MEELQASGNFSPPSVKSMELALERSLEHVARAGCSARVLMDVWDAQQFFDCDQCGVARAQRIQRMNLSQKVQPRIECECD
jgi:hypothetical protein